MSDTAQEEINRVAYQENGYCVFTPQDDPESIVIMSKDDPYEWVQGRPEEIEP